MDDVGDLLLSVRVYVFHTELLGEQHIDLDGNDGILFTKHVLILNIQLGTVESGLVHADGILHAQIVQNLLHHVLSLIPLLGRALILILGVLGIPLGEAEGAILQHTHGVQTILSQLQTALELLFQLIRAQHQVTLGDG